MNKRPLCLGAVAFVLGVLYAQTKHPVLLVFLGIFLGQSILWGYHKRGKAEGIKRGVILSAIGLLAWFHTTEEMVFREEILQNLEDGDSTRIQGTVYKQESKEDTNRIYLEKCHICMGTEMVPCNQILVYLNTDVTSVGDTILVNGTIKELEPARNQGNFDEWQFYQSQKIDFKFYGESVEILGNQNTPLERLLCKKKSELQEVYINNTDKKTAGLLQTMLLGEKEFLDEEVKSLYQKVGFSHILAISGLHVSLIGMGIYRLLKKWGCALVPAGILSGASVLAFGFLTGGSPQIKRAVWMFGVLMMGNILGRSYDSITALSLSGILLLWENPFLVGYAGFLLSFFAVTGISVVGKIFVGENEKSKLRESILMNLAIQLTTLPILAYFYYELPVYAMGLNLLLLPSVGILLSLGLLGGIFGMYVSPVAKVLFFVCRVFFQIYEKTCLLFLKLPGAIQIVGQPSRKVLICYYLLLLFLCLGIHYWKRKALLSVGTVLLLGILLLFSGEKKEFQIQVLDVGQGDGILIQSKDGENFFVDGGSTDVKQVGKYRILPCLKARGVQRIDVWFVSHCDEDHINGLVEVLEGEYPVECVVFSAYVVQEENYETLLELAKEKGCRILYLKEGQQIKTKTLCFTQCANMEMTDGDDKNAASMVLLLESGNFRGLLTGDIGKEQEEKLSDLGEITWYKAAHHGSKESNTENFLQELKPEIATISCGENNRYGHPAKEAVLHMEEAGSRIFYTMESGQIMFGENEEGVWVKEYVGKGD